MTTTNDNAPHWTKQPTGPAAFMQAVDSEIKKASGYHAARRGEDAEDVAQEARARALNQMALGPQDPFLPETPEDAAALAGSYISRLVGNAARTLGRRTHRSQAEAFHELNEPTMPDDRQQLLMTFYADLFPKVPEVAKEFDLTASDTQTLKREALRCTGAAELDPDRLEEAARLADLPEQATRTYVEAPVLAPKDRKARSRLLEKLAGRIPKALALFLAMSVLFLAVAGTLLLPSHQAASAFSHQPGQAVAVEHQPALLLAHQPRLNHQVMVAADHQLGLQRAFA